MVQLRILLLYISLVYINEIQPTKGFVLTYALHWILNILIIIPFFYMADFGANGALIPFVVSNMIV